MRESEGRAGQDHGFIGDKCIRTHLSPIKELSQENHEGSKNMGITKKDSNRVA